MRVARSREWFALHGLVAALASWMVAAPASGGVTPPATVHYQGVLRSASDVPLGGTYDMEFRFWSADIGGSEILIDKHTAAAGSAVTVAGGMFTVRLGEGSIVDGSGAGTYTDLASVFRDYSSVWLAVRVGAEDLSPRTRVVASPYALNASNVGGKGASELLDTSGAGQTKNGSLTMLPPGTNTTAVTGVGSHMGGYFTDGDNSGYTYAGYGDFGVYAAGTFAGGQFHDSDGSGYTYAGYGDYGSWGSGNFAGGFFRDGDESGYAYVGYGDWGISAYGNMGAGLFDDLNSSGIAYVAYGDEGIYAAGNFVGGEFHDLDGSGYANVGYGDYGISAYGNLGGGAFQDLNSSGVAVVANGDEGIFATGNTAGGEFSDWNGTGHAYVGYGDRGIWAKGTFAGGTFSHPDNVTFWADVATPTKKIQGTGTVSFVQNHPDATDRVVVYAAPEGDEVAVYTRGTARLVGGEARVRLGATFALVANPDIGLTASITPRGRSGVLFVESVDPTELIVRTEEPASRDASFDYMVWGLRIGFERHPVVQRKEHEAFLPDTAAFDALGAADPDLGSTTPVTRFAAMRASLGERAPLDLRRADALVARINAGKGAVIAATAAAAEAERAERAPRPPSTGASVASVSQPVGRSTPSLPPTIVPQLTFAPVTGRVRTGDVLVLDATMPGYLSVAERAADRGVAGCALETPAGLEVPAGQAAVGTTGVVLCRVDASYGAIAVGDLLTTSATAAHAMRAMASSEGAILGKAMEPLAEGTGTIRVLVSLR